MTDNWSGAQAMGPSFLGPDGVDSVSGPVSHLGHSNPQPDFWAGASPYLMGDRFAEPVSSVMEDSDLSPNVPPVLVPEHNPYATSYPLHGGYHPMPPPRLVQPPPGHERGPIQYAVGPSQHYAPSGLYGMAPEHPNATMTLVFGVVGIVVPILSFVAWYIGGEARNQIRDGAPYSWHGSLTVGYWMGKIVGIFTIVCMGFFLVMLFFSIVLQVSLLALIFGYI